MKTFKDLEFKRKYSDENLKDMGFYGGQMASAKQSMLEFDNGYSVSVISGHGAYGNTERPYELAVFLGDDLRYPEFTNGDVVGYLNSGMVTEYMRKVQEL